MTVPPYECGDIHQTGHTVVNGETSQSLRDRYPTTPVFSHIEVDLPEQEQKVVWATQCVPAADLFNQTVTGTAWRSKPSWYIVAKNDRTVQPELERFLAKRMGATTYEAASSHVAMLSNPKLVIDAIRAAAHAAQGAMVA